MAAFSCFRHCLDSRRIRNQVRIEMTPTVGVIKALESWRAAEKRAAFDGTYKDLILKLKGQPKTLG